MRVIVDFFLSSISLTAIFSPLAEEPKTFKETSNDDDADVVFNEGSMAEN